MMKRVAREAAVFAFYLLLAVAMTWPLAKHLDTAVSDLGDPLLVTWILDWVCHALTTSPLSLYHAPMYHPSPYTLAYSENLVGVAVLVLPFHLAGLSPITVYNIALLIGFALSGYGMFVLARLVTGSSAAALVAGVFFAFAPFKFDHLSHLQIISSAWLPLLLAAVLYYWRKPDAKSAALITGAFVMNGLTNVYYFLFGSLTAVLTIAFLAIVEGRRERRFWLTLVGSFVLGGLLLLPFLLPYRWLAKTYGMVRSEGEAISGSAPAIAWLVTTPRSVVYGKLGADEVHRHEMQLFPGLLVLALAVVALFRARPSPGLRPPSPHIRGARALKVAVVVFVILGWMGAITDRIEWSIFGVRLLSFNSGESFFTIAAILLVVLYRHRLREFVARSRFTYEEWAAVVWMIVGFIGSFGMHLFFHAFLYKRITIFQAIRAPVRWAVIAYIGLAVWAAMGALTLVKRRFFLSVLLVLLVLLDLWPKIRWEHAVPDVAPVYRWIKDAQVAPAIELPMANGMEFALLLGAMHHRQPLFNGASHFGAPLQAKLRTKNDAQEFDDEFLTLLEENGGKLVVVHVHALGDMGGKVRTWLAAQLASGRLAFVHSFDHEIGGDFVFAITRNVTDWQRLRAPEAPDGAGHLPSQKLARMLEGRTTHSNAIMTWIDAPKYGDVVRGPLHVRGWTLSPFPIRRATLLLHNGSVRVDAPLVDPRPDVKRDYGWYYFVERPGFEAVVERRPKGVPRATEFQIEVEDATGRVMRTADVLIDWEDAQ